MPAPSAPALLPNPAENPKVRWADPEAEPLEENTRSRPKDQIRFFNGMLLVCDWVVATAAIVAGFGFRIAQKGHWEELWSELVKDFSPVWIWVFGGGCLYSWLMIVFQTYESSNLLNIHRWAKNFAKTAIGWPIVMLAVFGLLQYNNFAPRLGLFYSVILLVVFQFVWRSMAFVFLMQPMVREAAFSRIIVVGWNSQIAKLVDRMRRDMSHMGEFVGCVPAPGGHFLTKPPPHVPVLGDYSSLPQFVTDCGATSIILADTASPTGEIEQLISFCHREYLDFQLVPKFFPALRSSLKVRTIDGVPLLGVRELPLDKTINRVIKRVCDIVGSMVGLVLFAPVIVFFGLLVYLESPGPVIYRQKRATRSGKTFYIYKIRSMALNAESFTGPVWAKRDDPRRLKIGAFMRRTNIDELPQFWNVLKGDMSLVGPRPERPELIEKFKNEIPNYNVRHEVKAGLTGWAQIKGYRGDTDLKKRIELDLHYLETWSPLLDLYCLFATLFRSKNAH